MNTARLKPVHVVRLVAIAYVVSVLSMLLYSGFDFVEVTLGALVVAISVGLWRLESWARTAEIAMCIVQLVAASGLALAWISSSTQFSGEFKIEIGSFALLLLFALIVVLNASLLWYFLSERVRELFSSASQGHMASGKMQFIPEKPQKSRRRLVDMVFRGAIGLLLGVMIGLAGWLTTTELRWFYAVPILGLCFALGLNEVPRAWLRRPFK